MGKPAMAGRTSIRPAHRIVRVWTKSLTWAALAASPFFDRPLTPVTEVQSSERSDLAMAEGLKLTCFNGRVELLKTEAVETRLAASLRKGMVVKGIEMHRMLQGGGDT